MGVQASTASSLVASPTLSPVHFPANVGFQAGHMGLLNLAAFLPGFRSLHPGTFSSPATPFWNAMEQPAGLDKTGAFFDLASLHSDWFSLAGDTLGHNSVRVSQPMGFLGDDVNEAGDQSDLSIFLRDDDVEAGVLSDGNVSWSTLESPCEFSGSPHLRGTRIASHSDGFSSASSSGRTTPAPEFLSPEEHHKRTMPDSGDYERILKMARLGEQTEARARILKEDESVKTAVKGAGGKPLARRKRPRTAEVMERSRLESARARERRKVKKQNLERAVQERTERALALQQQVQALQTEAQLLRSALQTQFGICVAPGALQPALAQYHALSSLLAAPMPSANGNMTPANRPIAIRPRPEANAPTQAPVMPLVL